MEHSTLRLGGLVVYWTTAARSDADQIIDGLTNLNYANLAPDERKPLSVLKDSIGDALEHHRNIMIRPLSSKDGYDIVREEKNPEVNGYHHVATVKWIDGKIIVSNNGDTFQPNLTFDETTAIRDHFEINKALCSGQQITAILLSVVQRLGGITIRQSGAVYWIPIDQKDEWSKIARVIEQAAVRGETNVHSLSVTMDEQAHAAVIEGITTEIATATAELQAELQTELSPLQLKRRQERISQMEAKVSQYEHALGEHLTAIREKLDDVRTAKAFAAILET